MELFTDKGAPQVYRKILLGKLNVRNPLKHALGGMESRDSGASVKGKQEQETERWRS